MVVPKAQRTPHNCDTCSKGFYTERGKERHENKDLPWCGGSD